MSPLPSSPSRPLFSVAQQFSVFFLAYLRFWPTSPPSSLARVCRRQDRLRVFLVILSYFLFACSFSFLARPPHNKSSPCSLTRLPVPQPFRSRLSSRFLVLVTTTPTAASSWPFLSLAPTFLFMPRQDPRFAFTIFSESRTSFVLSSGNKLLSALSRPSRARVLFRDRSPPRESALPDLLLGLPLSVTVSFVVPSCTGLFVGIRVPLPQSHPASVCPSTLLRSLV